MAIKLEVESKDIVMVVEKEKKEEEEEGAAKMAMK